MSENNDNKPPILNVRGKLVGLGPLVPEHRDIVTGYMQNLEVAVMAGGGFRAESMESLGQNFFDPELKKPNHFAIYELEKLKMIGTTHLRDVDNINGTATVGIEIGFREYWGRGYGSEAVRLLLDYGFSFLNLYNIWLDTSSYNERAIRAYEKAGFKEVGRRRGSEKFGGQRHDQVYMDCLADEFEPPVPGWYRL